MKLAIFCLCILGAVGGMWLADQGAWASAGAIWVIAILLGIDSAASSITKELATRDGSLRQGQRADLSISGGLPASRAPTPPPQKKAVTPFKIGDRVFVKSVGMDGEVCARTDGFLKVREIGGTSASCWYEVSECQLISKENEFKVGDRVRIRSELGAGTVGKIISITDHGTATVDFGPTPPILLWISSIEFPLDSLELICEKQS